MMHGGLGFDHTEMHPWLDPLGNAMRLVYYDHRDNCRWGEPLLERSRIECLCTGVDALREHLDFREVAVLGYF
jgi:hypothetical protein